MIPRRLLGPDGFPIERDDGFLIDHYRTFSAIFNAHNRTYRSLWDEALRQSPDHAHGMRRDAFILSLLQERALAVAHLPWHLEPENSKDERQKECCDRLTKILKRTPSFTAQRLYLLWWGSWYGRYGSQLAYGPRMVDGEEAFCVANHHPVNGDKIQYDWDGHPLVFVNPSWAARYREMDPEGAARRLVPNDRNHTTYGDRAPMLRLDDPRWRERWVIYRFLRDDADYFDAESAGGVHGVGIRHMVYWTWFLRNQMLEWAVSYMEKVGSNGILLFYYDYGNKEQKAAAEEGARSSTTQSVFAVPRMPNTQHRPAVEQLPANVTGIEALRAIIADYFERHIERLVVGQSMSAGADNESGLGGTGRAELSKDTKHQIIKFDAENLSECLTEDLVAVVQRHNLPAEDQGYHFRFVINVPDPAAQEKLAAGKVIFDMGVELKEDEIREAAGFSKPEDDDDVIGMAGERLPVDEEGDPFGDTADPDGADAGDNSGSGGPVNYSHFDESKHPRGKPENKGQFTTATAGGTVERGKARHTGDAAGKLKRREQAAQREQAEHGAKLQKGAAEHESKLRLEEEAAKQPERPDAFGDLGRRQGESLADAFGRSYGLANVSHERPDVAALESDHFKAVEAAAEDIVGAGPRRLYTHSRSSGRHTVILPIGDVGSKRSVLFLTARHDGGVTITNESVNLAGDRKLTEQTAAMPGDADSEVAEKIRRVAGIRPGAKPADPIPYSAATPPTLPAEPPPEPSYVVEHVKRDESGFIKRIVRRFVGKKP